MAIKVEAYVDNVYTYYLWSEVAMDRAMDAPESSCRALFIGIDFCESSCVQLSVLTGVLQGSLLKKQSSNTRVQ